MDAEAFLVAQLWLHALPPSAWPGERNNALVAAASSGGDLSDGIILSDARCCLLLDAIWPTAYGRGSSRGGALDGVATSRRHRQLRFLPSRKNARESLSGRTGSFHGSFHESFHASKEGKKGGGGDETGGESPLPESVVDFTGEFDFGLAIVRGTGSDGAGAASAASAAGEYLGEVCGARKEMPASRTDDSRPRGSVGGSGVLLLRIDGRVYQAEHTLIERIAYPKGGGGFRSNGGDGVGHKGPQNGNPQQGQGVPSSTALPREEESSSAAARHFAGDPAPVGVGGAARTRKRRPDVSTCAPQADNAYSSGASGDDSDCGAGFVTGRRESSSTFAAAGGRDGEIAGTTVAGAKRKKKLGARDERVGPTRSAEGKRGSRWDTDGGGGGGGGGEDSGRGSPPSPHRGGLPAGDCRCARGSARHSDVCSCRCDDVEGRAAVVEVRRKTGACCSGRGGGGAGCDSGGVESGSPTVDLSGDKGGVFGAGDNGGTPYCGLLFPGVVLKFWLPRRRGEVGPACSAQGSGARLEAVERLQGVVTEIMRGLSSSTRAHPLAMATGEMGQVPNFNSPPPSGSKESGLGSNGCRNRRAAWDEFVYGTHVLLSLEHEHEQEQMRGDGQDDGCDGVGTGGCHCCEGRAKSSSAATKRARSTADGVGGGPGGNQPPCSLDRGPSERSGSGWECKGGSYDGGPSDLGRRRALASLAECFSRARVSSTTRSVAKSQLQAAEINAERALEDTLDRAFPQDLSQRKDSDSRKSTVAELEACCARARAARESLLPLDLLPAPEMLRKAN